MLEILQFIFSSFWIWLGTLIMLTASLAALVQLRLFVITTKKNSDNDNSVYGAPASADERVPDLFQAEGQRKMDEG